MNLRYYFDHHVPAAIAEGLLRRNVDVLTVAEDAATEWGDLRLLERAAELNRVLVTMDTDFLAMAEECWITGREFYGIVFVPQGRLAIGRVIEDLELIARTHDVDEFRKLLQRLPL